MAATIESLQSEILALRADVKNLAKMVRKAISAPRAPYSDQLDVTRR